MGGDGKSLNVSAGDRIKVSLGYNSELVKVFSGNVDNVDREYSQMRVQSLGSSASLHRFRLNRIYTHQTAGQIVSDLISALAQELANTQIVIVGKGEIMDGPSFPAYVIDDRLSVYEHIERLANKCGFIFYTTTDDSLIFKRYERMEAHRLTYGEDIVGVNMVKIAGPHKSVLVYGESPASWVGSETYHWLTKKEVLGSTTREAGTISGPHKLIIQDPTIRDKETAQSVVSNIASRVMRGEEIQLKIVGNPKIMVNDAVQVEGTSVEAPTGSYRVMEVEHYMNKVNGFVSIITCVEE